MHSSVILLTLLISHVYTRDVDYCFVDEDDPYLYMATRTAYHFVHAGKIRFQDVPNCRAEQVWMLGTQGTQCPSQTEISEMLALTDIQSQIINNHEARNSEYYDSSCEKANSSQSSALAMKFKKLQEVELIDLGNERNTAEKKMVARLKQAQVKQSVANSDGRMCNRDLENLKRWKPDAYLVIERAEVLTPQGVEDMRLLARRLQSNFPQLLQPSNENITAQNYVFKTTDGRDSMGSFMEGLFGDRQAVDAEEVSVNDTLLTAYKTCNVWDNERNNISMEEVIRFEEGPEFQNLIQNVSRRLGFLYDISKESILTMYNMCRYEKAWTVTKLSPWCAVFSKEDLRVLEYREDLHYYYKAGYGREINAQLGCTLLQDMMNHFWKVEQDRESREPKGVFYFSDIISLQNLLTTLNINKDQMQLTPFNYKNMAKRHWRTSFMSSFAANLVAVFYKCDSSSQPNKVMFYLAEKLVLLDGCDVGLCDWEYFKQKFNPVLKHCNLNVCWKGNGVATYIPNFILVLLLSFYLAFNRN